MAYPKEDTAEWWDLVASGYRQLLANPLKFIIPGIDRDTQYAFKISEAENMAMRIRDRESTNLDSSVCHIAMPTEAFMESLEKKESEMEAFGARLLEPKVTVTEDLWKTVLMLD